AKADVEEYLRNNFIVEKEEPIPTFKTSKIYDHPYLHRYFIKPKSDRQDKLFHELEDDDFVVNSVMLINQNYDGAYVFSSGKNMGAFKGVGYPEDVADFYRLEEIEGYMWTAHNRFPTNTPGWWGGAHPFTLLDWSIVHNGEISSYGINKRYLEMYKYNLALRTDTEVITYILDLLIRKHKIPVRLALTVLASPFYQKIDKMENDKKNLFTALRQVYGSALLNGPFAIVFGYSGGMVAMNDRIKLRPLVAASNGDFTYVASEEAAIRAVCQFPDMIWSPKAGEPVMVEFDDIKEKTSLKGGLLSL
ncbi:MAG: glutamine amidotransferase family protein, partial [Deltaproteobacteria bacterium]|nr:glutamine amidotransferase family protein [Deltaproteobacteria bacterium]